MPPGSNFLPTTGARARGAGLTDDGFTGLELVILVVVLIAGAILLLVYLHGSAPDLSRTFPGGLLAESMYMSGDHIYAKGDVYGFSMVSTSTGTPPIVFVHDDPGRLGAVQMVVSLFIGDTGAIDMDRVQVQWAHANRSELLGKISGSPLICPNWTISKKSNMLPGHTADSDEWLEPNEQFELTLCSSDGVRPYEKFSLTVQPDGSAMPLILTRSVPPWIRPVMDLH